MIKNESDLNDEFLNNFPKIYQTPSLTNDYFNGNFVNAQPFDDAGRL